MKANQNLNFIVTLFIATMLTASAQSQTIHYVDMDATGQNDGTSWNDAFVDLQDALSFATPGQFPADQIWVAEGSYSPGSNASDTFQMEPGVEVYGGFNATETSLGQRDFVNNVTILSGAPKEVIVTGASGANSQFSRLDGFTLSGASQHAIRNSTSSQTYENLIIENNDVEGYYGAGMLNISNSNPVVANCLFRNNKSTHLIIFDPFFRGGGNGGAMHNSGESEPVILDCVFENNEVDQANGDFNHGFGGAIYHTGAGGAAPLWERCQFNDNRTQAVFAQGWGGAVSIIEADVNFRDCSFRGDGNGTATESAFGGGIYIRDGSMELRNCTFDKLSIAKNGGAIDAHRTGVITILNTTFDANDAGTNGGAMFSGVMVHLAKCCGVC